MELSFDMILGDVMKLLEYEPQMRKREKVFQLAPWLKRRVNVFRDLKGGMLSELNLGFTKFQGRL